MQLTEEQQAVVDIVSGRHLVLAPPGSGKTEMLSQRILGALKNGVSSYKMLCATFTNRAAFEMRDRVEQGGKDLKLPDVGNLHHFCKNFLVSIGRIRPGKTILDEVQQREFIEECARRHFDDFIFERIRARYRDNPDASFYGDLLKAVLVKHQERIKLPKEFRGVYPRDMLELVFKTDIVYKMACDYQGLKRKFDALDFDDLLNETYRTLVARPLSEARKFQWVQIDEVQDLNPLQWEIVRRLTSKDAVSVFFGDLEQSIYSFMGADINTFYKETEDCEKHYFKVNFRATPKLLKVLTVYSKTALNSKWDFDPQPSDPNRKNGYMRMEDAGGEMLTTTMMVNSGLANEVAILTRTNAEADYYEEEASKRGMKVMKVSGLDVFAYAPMRDFMAFLALLLGKVSTMEQCQLLRHFTGHYLSPVDARRVVHLDNLKSRYMIWSMRKRLQPFINEAKRAAKRGSLDTIFGVFARLALGNSIPYTMRELRPDLPRSVLAEYDNWSASVGYAKKRIKVFLNYVSHCRKGKRGGILEWLEENWEILRGLKEADLLTGEEEVVVSTIHKAKGRQFDAVLVPAVKELLNLPQGDKDELRRLLYVAMSRAKRHLVLFTAKNLEVLVPIVPYFSP